MPNILTVFDFKKKELFQNELNVILDMLTSSEKTVFNTLKLSDHALTASEVHELYIDHITEDKNLNQNELKTTLRKNRSKKPVDVKSEFIRKKGIKVPTNRTTTRILENLKEAGYIVKRNSLNKRAKAYYCLYPSLKVALQRTDEELTKKVKVKEMKKQLTLIKDYINKNKNQKVFI